MILSFSASIVLPPQFAFAQNTAVPTIISPAGTLIGLSQRYDPVLIKGIALNPDDPLQIDFILSPGDTGLKGNELQSETKKLINYFLASLTVPKKNLWVNLSPYEESRIIAAGLDQTELGRDMLAQDYTLKQLTASLMSPEDPLGAKFWDRVNAKVKERYGDITVPISSFHKIWIVPQYADLFVNGNTVLVVDSHLKVMLEDDYLALESNRGHTDHGLGVTDLEDEKATTAISKEVIREILLPEIEAEVNRRKNFAVLRQMFHAMILAKWYKENLKESFLARGYVDQNKIEGIDIADKNVKEKIYRQYKDAFEKGVYDFVKEQYDPLTQQVIPRKYFTGGIDATDYAAFASEQATAQDVRRVGSSLFLAGVTLAVSGLLAEPAYPQLPGFEPVQAAQQAVDPDKHNIASYFFDQSGPEDFLAVKDDLDQMFENARRAGRKIVVYRDNPYFLVNDRFDLAQVFPFWAQQIVNLPASELSAWNTREGVESILGARRSEFEKLYNQYALEENELYQLNVIWEQFYSALKDKDYGELDFQTALLKYIAEKRVAEDFDVEFVVETAPFELFLESLKIALDPKRSLQELFVGDLNEARDRNAYGAIQGLLADDGNKPRTVVTMFRAAHTPLLRLLEDGARQSSTYQVASVYDQRDLTAYNFSRTAEGARKIMEFKGVISDDQLSTDQAAALARGSFEDFYDALGVSEADIQAAYDLYRNQGSIPAWQKLAIGAAVLGAAGLAVSRLKGRRFTAAAAIEAEPVTSGKEDESALGGIDFNPENLQINTSGSDFQFNFSDSFASNIFSSFRGISPRINMITPIANPQVLFNK